MWLRPFFSISFSKLGYSFSSFSKNISFNSFIYLNNLSQFPKAKLLFNNNIFFSTFSFVSLVSSILLSLSLFDSITIFRLFSSQSFSSFSSDRIVSQSHKPYKQIFLKFFNFLISLELTGCAIFSLIISNALL